MEQATTKTVIDFAEHITKYTQDFTGRTWVFEEIDRWLKVNSSRFFLLTAEPGGGKTALAARICEISQGTAASPDNLAHFSQGFISAYHFCLARDDLWIDPLTFSRSLALQLSRYPQYTQALLNISERDVNIRIQQNIHDIAEGTIVQAIVIQNLTVTNLNAQESFNRIVRDPLHAIYRDGFNESLLIVIDGLDEALVHAGKPTIVELLSRLASLPSQIRFLLTSRPESRVEEAFPDADGLLLSAPSYEKQNSKDISEYIRHRLAPDGEFAEKLARYNQNQINTKIATLTERAVGNFQYIFFLLQAIAQNRRTFDDLEGLPEGLDALYADSLQRVVQLGNKDWSIGYSPLIGILSVAQESLTFEQIQAFTGQREGSAWEYINDLQQFIEIAQVKQNQDRVIEYYRLYHQSFIYFLRLRQLDLRRKKIPNRYYLPAVEWHKQVADVCEQGGLATIWQVTKGNLVEHGRREYARQHYITHLYLAQEWQRMYDALDGGDFGRAKIKFYPGMLPYIRDLELGQQATTRDELSVEDRLALLPALWRYSLLHRSLHSQIDNYPDNAFYVMATLGKQKETLELVSMLTDQHRQIAILLGLATLTEEEGHKADSWEIFSRAINVISKCIEYDKDVVELVIQTLAKSSSIEQKKRFFGELANTASLIRQDAQKIAALVAIAVVLAELQDREKAALVASAIPYVHQEAKMLREVVRKLVKAELWDSATTIAHSISDEAHSRWAQSIVVVGLVQAKQWEQAKALAQLQGSKFRFDALSTVVEARIEAEPEVAEEILSELTVVATSEDFNTDYKYMYSTTSDRDFAFNIIAGYATTAHLWNKAISLASSIYNIPLKKSALGKVITALAKDQQWERAIALAWSQDMYSSPDYVHDSRLKQVESLSKIVQALMDADRKEQARGLLTQMLQTVCHQGQKDSVLSAVVEALIAGQLWDPAISITHTISDTDTKFSALIDLSNALSIIQPEQTLTILGKAEAIANENPQHAYSFQRDWRERKLIDIVEVLAKMQLWEQAIELANTFDTEANTKRDEAYTKIVNALLDEREWNRGVSVAKNINNEYEQERVLVTAIKSLVEVKEWDKALTIVQDIEDINNQIDALTAIIDALTKAQIAENEVENRSLLNSEDTEDLDVTSILRSTMQEHWNQTMQTIQSLNCYSVLNTLITSLTRAEAWYEAFDAVALLRSQKDLASAYLFIIIEMKEAGLINIAIHIAHLMSESSQKAEALASLALPLTLKKPEQASELLTEALAISQPIADDVEIKTKALKLLTDNLSKARQWDKVITIAQAIPTTSEQVMIFIEAATALFSADLEQASALLAEAETIVRTPDINDDGDSSLLFFKIHEKIAQLHAIANALVAIGQLERAAELSDEVKSLVEEIRAYEESEPQEAEERERANISGPKEEQQRQDAALVFERLAGEDRFSDDNLLRDLTFSLAQAGQWGQALAMAWSIKQPEHKVQVTTMLTRALIEAEQWDEAYQLIFEAEAIAQSMAIGDEQFSITIGNRDFALLEVVRVLVQMDELERAEIASLSISENPMRDNAISQIIEARAQKRQWNEVLDLLQKIQDADWKVSCLRILIHAFIQWGEQVRALQLVQQYWVDAPTRNDLIHHLELAADLISDRPEDCWALYNAFAWVNNFLKG